MDKKEYFKILSQELHKPATKRFQRAQVITTGIDDVWGGGFGRYTAIC